MHLPVPLSHLQYGEGVGVGVAGLEVGTGVLVGTGVEVGFGLQYPEKPSQYPEQQSLSCEQSLPLLVQGQESVQQ